MDQADALAELAIRIRDHVSGNDFDGHTVSLRIGIITVKGKGEMETYILKGRRS
jgi:hypothetical protein